MNNNRCKKLLPKRSLILRGLAGGYLLYSAYSIFLNYNSNRTVSGLAILIGMATFAIIGSIFVITAVLDAYRGKYRGGKLDSNPSTQMTADNSNDAIVEEIKDSVIEEEKGDVE